MWLCHPSGLEVREEKPSSRGQALWVPTVPDTRQISTRQAPSLDYPQAQGLALRYLTDRLSNLTLRRNQQNPTKGVWSPGEPTLRGCPSMSGARALPTVTEHIQTFTHAREAGLVRCRQLN